ncbi:MAG TPA: hypothetical protein VGH73_04980 [Thermoanaerobaculia bacterium]|jgi:hypothetical protein
MKISRLSLLGGLLLLLASTAVIAAPLPPAFLASLSGVDAGSNSPNFTPALPAASNADTCGIPAYSCQPCPESSAPLKLCSTTNCGTYVIVHCNACAQGCRLPPG